MMLFRLALPAAALAAVVSVYPAAAEDNPVRAFLNDEFASAQPAAETAAAPDQTTEKQVAAIDKNAWAGLVPAEKTKQKAALSPLTPATAAANSDNAPILALIDKHANASGLPVAFARAIVRIESNFNPRATGSQREVGLMQIKYETARGIGFAGTREQLYDPDTNLQWGMKYLAMSWKLGGSTPCGAVMKYQGGHAVTRMSPAANAYCAKVKSHMASAN
jgi:soluble lytic murein transglycosylase-like protein